MAKNDYENDYSSAIHKNVFGKQGKVIKSPDCYCSRTEHLSGEQEKKLIRRIVFIFGEEFIPARCYESILNRKNNKIKNKKNNS
jgi:hypothetical protein